VYLPINYRPTPETPNPNLPDLEMIAPGVGDLFVRGIYPIYDLNYYLDPGEIVEWNENINGSSGRFLALMATRRRLYDPLPDFLYAWFRGNPFSGNGQANPSGLAAFGNTDPARFQRTFAHELGHLFGLPHNTRRLDQVGFDTLNLLALGRVKGTNLFDIMAAGLLTNQAWVDIQTYNHFLDRPVLQCPSDMADANSPLGYSYGEYLFLTGIINADGSAQLNPAYKLTGRQDYTPPSEDPTHVLIMQDRAGNELYRVPFDGRPVEYDGDIGTTGPIDAAFSLVLPAFPELGRVLLERDGTVLAMMDRRDQAPVTNLEPMSNIIGGKALLAWQTSNAAAGELTYSVQFSPDDGMTWYPLAVDIKENSLLLDSTNMKKTDRGIVRVLATDGLNTTIVEQKGLNVL
jgi:hypothetical protein